jgi:preprotein translocase SecF subunit
VFFELIKPDTHIDFLSKWRVCVGISIAVLLLGIAAIPLRGVRLGIDFQGGTEMQVRFAKTAAADEGAVRSVLEGLGIRGASVVRYGTGEAPEFIIKFGGERRIEDAEAAGSLAAEEEEAEPEGERPATVGAVDESTDRVVALQAQLERAIGPLTVERVEFVGPRVGEELRQDGLMAIGIACLLILIYIAFRFSMRFAPGAVIALVHDLTITASLWILLGLEFDLRVLAALLAILGYSLNDTIIVFDRIRENLEIRTKHDLAEVLNHSVNQTLSRTLITSGSTLGAVLALLFLGGPVIQPFALAMAIGIVVGTYSSIYIAAPTLLWLEKRTGGDKASGTKPVQRARPQRAKAARA